MASQALRQQVRETWNIDVLVIHLFRPLWQSLREQEELSPQDCFLARLLLIHEYRKLLLRDPQLPDELLPADWEGKAARLLCRNIYKLVWVRSQEWLVHALEVAGGELPEVGERFYQRFDGNPVVT